MKKGYKEIFNLAIPSIVSNITVPLLGLVDLMIVGHIGNEKHIGAIAIGTMIFNVLYWVLGFLRMGTSGMTAQAYGANEHQESICVLMRALAIGVGMGLLFIVFQRPIEWIMLYVMNTPQDSRLLVQTYIRIAIWGAPAMLGLYGLTGWFVGMQNTKIPMVIAIFQNIVNIAVSVFLIYLCRWKIEGVAAGTLVAQWSGFVLAMVYLIKGLNRKMFFKELVFKDMFSLSIVKTVFVSIDKWLHFFSVNRDIFLRTLCLVGVNLFFTSAGGKQGALMLSVNTLLMTLFTLFSYFMDGFAYAGEALTGKYYGAREFQNLKKLINKLFVIGFLTVFIFTIVYIFGGLSFLRILTDNENIVYASQPYLIWIYLVPLAGVVAFIYDGVFIGMTFTRGMLVSSLVATLIFFSFYYIAEPYLKNNALWISFLFFLSFRGIGQYLWLKSVKELSNF